MPERIYELSAHTDIIVFFGVNNANLYLLKNLFPQVRIVGRGHAIKIEGDEENVNLVMQHLENDRREIHHETSPRSTHAALTIRLPAGWG